jgi:diphosphoinositol-polyphosphate diphosphatase
MIGLSKQAGTIPFRVVDDVVMICLVSSRKRKKKFVLPKGSVRSMEKAGHAAMRETVEEAGLKGSISRKAIKIKAKSAKPKITVNSIRFFPMLVKDIMEKWPEGKYRKRIWVDVRNLPKSKMVKRDLAVLNSRRFKTIAKDLRSKA